MKGHASVLCLASLLVVGCGSKNNDPLFSAAQTIPAISTGVSIIAATAAECATGGIVVRTFLDVNANGVLDGSEVALSTLPVCNGAAGAGGSQGYGAGIQVTAAATSACPAGGNILTAFIDKNNNGALDAGETTTAVSTVCNGQNAVLTSALASSSQCPAGGVVYSSRVGSGTPQVSVVCNGTNGSDGQNAEFRMGAIGKPVEKKNYSACHHDYLYIPDADDRARGWLILRHQKNGAEDQGIGSTGFNTWNVDIADFSLLSEDQKVTYCKAHWNAEKRVLSYEVVDKSDGHAGESGSIEM